MNRSASVMLVVLRLAIGWHFLFEAVEKINSVYVGAAETNKVWTSEGYFREGTGPMGRWVRGYLGDTDELLLSRLTPLPIPESETHDNFAAHRYMPVVMEREWNDYLDRFATHYGLDPTQRELAAKRLEQQKDLFVRWLTNRPSHSELADVLEVKRSYPSGTVEMKITVPKQVEYYRSKVAELRTIKGPKLAVFGKDVEKQRRLSVMADVAAIRAEFVAALDKKTADMRKALEDTLPRESEKSDGKKPPPLAKAYQDKGPVPEPTAPAKRIWIIDWSTRWGLLLIGISLMLGLFTRLGCIGGAGFLFMTLLTIPPLPWLPSPPNTEGHYLFVNKNMIEMLALLVLACLPTGRWFGVDAIVHMLNPFRKSRRLTSPVDLGK